MASPRQDSALARRKAWRIALIVILCIAALPAGCYFVYRYPTELAQARAMELCKSVGPARVIDHHRWAYLSGRTQAERLKDPSLDTHQGPMKVVPVQGSDVIFLQVATIYNAGKPVLELRNPIVSTNDPIAVALTPNFPSYNCLLDTPSIYRSVLIGY